MNHDTKIALGVTGALVFLVLCWMGLDGCSRSARREKEAEAERKAEQKAEAAREFDRLLREAKAREAKKKKAEAQLAAAKPRPAPKPRRPRWEDLPPAYLYGYDKDANVLVSTINIWRDETRTKASAWDGSRVAFTKKHGEPCRIVTTRVVDGGTMLEVMFKDGRRGWVSGEFVREGL